MFSKPTVTSSLIAVGLAAAGITVATWMSTSHAQGPGGTAGENRSASKDRRDTQVTNLKQIALAFHNYISRNNQLPAMAFYGPDGLPTLSWRVAILPYLEQNELYSQFRQDEPWDSPHNKALLGRMPAVFETPVTPAPAGQTRIRGFAGAGTLFDGQRAISLSDVTDGTSNTVLVAVAEEPTPWTKPGELPFVPGRILAALDASDSRGFMMAMLDGSVRSLGVEHSRLLPALITRAGGEIIRWPDAPAREITRPEQVQRDLLPTAAPMPQPAPAVAVAGNGGPTPVVAMPPMTSAPAPHPMVAGGGSGPASIQALDQRMRRLEDRLELILKRLDAMSGERSR